MANCPACKGTLSTTPDGGFYVCGSCGKKFKAKSSKTGQAATKATTVTKETKETTAPKASLQKHATSQKLTAGAKPRTEKAAKKSPTKLPKDEFPIYDIPKGKPTAPQKVEPEEELDAWEDDEIEEWDDMEELEPMTPAPQQESPTTESVLTPASPQPTTQKEGMAPIMIGAGTASPTQPITPTSPTGTAPMPPAQVTATATTPATDSRRYIVGIIIGVILAGIPTLGGAALVLAMACIIGLMNGSGKGMTLPAIIGVCAAIGVAMTALLVVGAMLGNKALNSLR